MSIPTKVISVRIPWDMYEEILQEAILHELKISEWIIVQIALVQRQQSNLDNIIQDVSNCGHNECPLRDKFNELLEILNKHY
jgi:hypothetical protein